MEKIDSQGNLLGFSILKVSSLKGAPLEVGLTQGRPSASQ